MSADNFNFVRRIQDKWHVWLNLSASCDREPQLRRPSERSFGSQEDAVQWADAQGYTEYGTEVDDTPVLEDEFGYAADDAAAHEAVRLVLPLMPKMTNHGRLAFVRTVMKGYCDGCGRALELGGYYIACHCQNDE